MYLRDFIWRCSRIFTVRYNRSIMSRPLPEIESVASSSCSTRPHKSRKLARTHTKVIHRTCNIPLPPVPVFTQTTAVANELADDTPHLGLFVIRPSGADTVRRNLSCTIRSHRFTVSVLVTAPAGNTAPSASQPFFYGTAAALYFCRITYLSSPTPSINKRPALDTSKMASHNSVSENEGIQNDHDYNEVDEMALEVNNVNINGDDRAVALAIKTNNTRQKNQEQLHTDCVDIYSKKGKFSWKRIEGCYIPNIVRIINGVKLQFVSIRMAETQLLKEYLHYLHPNMYTCTSVKSYFITDNEAVLLNEINNFHSDFEFGNAIFFEKKDCIVLLEDVQEFYTFVDVCYKVLLSNDNTGRKTKCGYILMNFESVLPYGIKDNKKYIPLFCFEGETENLQRLTVQLENWNLAYLKFCCKLQGINNDAFFASDSCTVVSLDDIKNSYSNNTSFEEYWPPNIIDTQLLTNENSTHVNPPGVWVKAPYGVVIAESSTIPYTFTKSAPVLPTNMPVLINTHQNGRPPNQMDSTIVQESSLTIGTSHVVPLPPLFESVNTTPVIGDTVSFANAVLLSLGMTTMNNSMTNSNVMSHSNQMQQLYSLNTINNSQAQQQQIQQQQHQQQQLIISTPQTLPSFSSQYMHGHLTNTELHNASRNVWPSVATPATESIGLTSQPCNPILTTVQDTSLHPRIGWGLTRIPERYITNGTKNIAAYKIEKAILHGRMIHCINANPHVYSDALITLRDLVQFSPLWTVKSFAQYLQNSLKIKLFSGNSEQLTLLWRCGLISTLDPECTPMAMLQDIRHWLNTVRLNFQNATAPPNM